MRILKLESWNNPNPNVVKTAVNSLRSGGIIIYPADTAGYSLGVNALDEKAIWKVFKIKKRPLNMPINIVVRNSTMAKRFCYWEKIAEKLAAKFLPGALTLILNKKKILPDLLTAGLRSVGIRIPDSPVALWISLKSNLPFTITTANISGRGISSFNLEEILSNFEKGKLKPDLIIDAGQLPPIPPSTILDLTQKPPVVLRQGLVTKEEIETILGKSLRLKETLPILTEKREHGKNKSKV